LRTSYSIPVQDTVTRRESYTHGWRILRVDSWRRRYEERLADSDLPRARAPLIDVAGTTQEPDARTVLQAALKAMGGENLRSIPRGSDVGNRRPSGLASKASRASRAASALWGLGAFGQPGVEKVLDILRTELLAITQQVGAPTIKHLCRPWCGGSRQ
jgi:hypothetical protein